MRFSSYICLSLFFAAYLFLTEVYAIPIPSQSVMPYDCPTCQQLSHEDVNISWSADDKPIEFTHTIHQHISRQYQIKVEGNQLQTGVAIETSAPGAVVRIAGPHTSQKYKFYIRLANNTRLNLDAAASVSANADELQHSAFAGELVALQLKPELGSGKFMIYVEGMPNTVCHDVFVIHVYEKNTPHYLRVSTNKARYRYGEELTVHVNFDENFKYWINKIEATLLSPIHGPIPFNLLKLSEHEYMANIDLLSNDNGQGANWTINVVAATHLDQQTLLWRGHTVFSYVIPSATIRQVIMTKNKPFAFAAQIDVATGSRYAIEAVLFGSDAYRKAHPIAIVQAASWFTPGRHMMHFAFDASKMNHAYKAPYYLGYLRLIDFGQLKPVFEYNGRIALKVLH